MILVKQKGVTLTEMVLVLLISSMIIVMAINQYELYKKEKDYFILKENVDLLFQAMKQYYQTNCRNGVLNPKKIIANDPNQPPFLSQKFPVNNTNNYVDSVWPRFTPVVSTENDAYFAQYNPTLQSRYQYACFYFEGFSDSLECTENELIKQEDKKNILVWQSQVAVKMEKPEDTVDYAAIAGAACATNKEPTEVIDCETDNVTSGEATYMVWQRLPSFSANEIRSPHWRSNYRVKMFNLIYTHDPMYEMYNQDAGGDYEYYLCGG